MLNIILFVLLGLVWLKAIIIGSDFSFFNWIKYGKLYTNWYSDRPTFKDELAWRDHQKNPWLPYSPKRKKGLVIGVIRRKNKKQLDN